MEIPDRYEDLDLDEDGLVRDLEAEIRENLVSEQQRFQPEIDPDEYISEEYAGGDMFENEVDSDGETVEDDFSGKNAESNAENETENVTENLTENVVENVTENVTEKETENVTKIVTVPKILIKAKNLVEKINSPEMANSENEESVESEFDSEVEVEKIHSNLEIDAMDTDYKPRPVDKTILKSKR